MRMKPFIAFITDTERRGTREYLFYATTRRRVERDVREWCKRTDWGATVVAIEPGVVHRGFASTLRSRLANARGRLSARGRTLPMQRRLEEREQVIGEKSLAPPAQVQPVDRDADELGANVG